MRGPASDPHRTRHVALGILRQTGAVRHKHHARAGRHVPVKLPGAGRR